MTEKVKVLLKDMKVESVLFQIGVLSTSRHPMFTGTSRLKDLLVNFMTNGWPMEFTNTQKQAT